MQTTGDGINDELRIYTGETSLSLAGPRIRWHGFHPRQAVHLAVVSFERGVMIQFCGIVRV